jgi:hypothetical protein
MFTCIGETSLHLSRQSPEERAINERGRALEEDPEKREEGEARRHYSGSMTCIDKF